jgi:hypothetical protein
MNYRLSPFQSKQHEADWLQWVLMSGKLSRISQHLALILHTQDVGPDGFTIESLMNKTGWGKTVIRDALLELSKNGIILAVPVLCSYCGKWTAADVHSDHVHPQSLGGADDESNRVPACSTCNQSKNDTPLLVWLARRDGAILNKPPHISRGMTKREIAVLTAILVCSNTHGVTAPGRKRLSEMTGYTEAGVAKTICDLRASGHIATIRRQAAGRGRAVAHYTVITPPFSTDTQGGINAA